MPKKIFSVSNDSTIRDGVEALNHANAPGYTEQILKRFDRGDAVAYMETLGNVTFSNAKGAVFPYEGGGAYVLLAPNAVMEFACPDGDIWFAHNDPMSSKVVIQHDPIDPVKLTDPVMDWLLNGRRGASSETMCRHLFGKSAKYRANNHDGEIDHPHDPSDFMRCRLFVEQTHCRDRLPEIAKLSPQWKILIEHWDELEQIMDAEVDWENSSGGRATNTYRAMGALLSIAAKKSTHDLFSYARSSVSGAVCNKLTKNGEHSSADHIRWLHKYGVDVNCQVQPTESIRTNPLATAVNRINLAMATSTSPKNINTSIVRALVECGADVNANYEDGVTIIDHVRENPRLSKLIGPILGIDEEVKATPAKRKARKP